MKRRRSRQRHRLIIDGLVNNAGYAVPGYYARTRWEDQEAFLRVMVTAPCELAHVLLTPMAQRRFGRIINVGSLAGCFLAQADRRSTQQPKRS